MLEIKFGGFEQDCGIEAETIFSFVAKLPGSKDQALEV